MRITSACAAILVAGSVGLAEAQVAPGPTLTNVPSTLAVSSVTPPVSTPIALSLTDVIRRGLERNLGVLLQEQEVRLRDGKRWQELSDVLPHLFAGVEERQMKLNPRAFGFPMDVVGPFNVFDARVFVTQPVLDLANFYEAKMEAAKMTSEQHSYRNVRDLVVSSVARLYFQVSATAALLAAAQVRAGSAAEVVLAVNRTEHDSLATRAGLQNERQSVIALQTTLTKQKLALAQAIGLPHGQPFTLTDQMPYTPWQPISPEAASDRAFRDRADFQALLAGVKAAEAKLRSASSQRLPTVHMDASYGKIGADPSSAKMTFGVQAIVRMPILTGGDVRGRLLEADAELRQQKAKLEDLSDGIYYEIQYALLDVQAADEQARLARGAMNLAEEQLARFRNRVENLTPAPVVFSPPRPIASASSARPGDSAEALQAQEAVATAHENFVSSVYTYNIAKIGLARALGVTEESYMEFLAGTSR